MNLIDLSLVIEPNNSEPVNPKIQYISHYEGASILGGKYGIGKEDFPSGMAISQEYICATSHTGTHMDAPLHYGIGMKSIEEVPLSWCFQRGVFIDVSNSKETTSIGTEEIMSYVAMNNVEIKPYDIVVIYTGADKLWGTKEYYTSYRGLSKAALEWILDFGVKVVGIDTFSMDPPFEVMLSNYKKKRDSSELWPAHILGRTKEYLQIERLTNLDKLKGVEKFQVCCFPIKVKNCGAGWVRAVAVIE